MPALKLALDHLILFLPVNPTTSLPSIPPFLNQSFNLSPGGFHADGLTSNTLIILSDGCYIELITFIQPSSAPTTHWWGPNAQFTGLKDWCLTTPDDAEVNHQRIGGTHAQPAFGGRRKDDGSDVKWAVTFPAGPNGGQGVRGRIPFFCHDVTERGVRVPLEKKRTGHPCGALGVLGITVIVKDKGLLDETRGSYTAVLGEEGQLNGDEVVFNVGRVHEVDGLESSVKVTLRLPRDEEEVRQTEKAGYVFGNVVLGARGQDEKTKGTKERIDGQGDGMSVGGLYVQYLQ